MVDDPGAPPAQPLESPAARPLVRPRNSHDRLTSLRTLVIGGALALVIGIVASYLAQQPSAVAVLSGGSATPTVEFPSDEVISSSSLSFKWRRASDTTRIVVVDLTSPERPIIDRTVSGDAYRPSDEERGRFVSGREYHWFVESRGDASRSSKAARFTVR